jgi:hypothetical protein
MLGGEEQGAAPADGARREHRGFTLLVVATVLGVAAAYALVRPIGEYAVGDDWAYVRSLRHLQEQGRLTILAWNPMSLVGLLVWGLLFTVPLGLSFTVTKLAVVTLFAIECLVMVAALRHFRVPVVLASLAVATLALNPLHFFHAFLFGTDVPALAWGLLAFLLYAMALDRGGRRGESALLLLASFFAGWAFLVRQSGALIAGAVLLYTLVWARHRLRSPRFLLAAMAPAAGMVGSFWWWYRYVHGPTAMLAWWEAQITGFVLHPDPVVVGRAAFALAVYLGFLLVPLSLVVRPLPLWPGSRPARAGLLAVALIGAGALLYRGLAEGVVFPYLRNKVTPFGYFRPNEVLLGSRDVLWARPVGWCLSVTFLGSFLVLVAALMRGRAVLDRGLPARASDGESLVTQPGARGEGPSDRSRTPPRDRGEIAPSSRQPLGPAASGRTCREGVRLLVVLFGIQLAYLLVTAPIVFDRHLLLIAPTVLLLFCVLVRDATRLRVAAFVVLVLPLAFYAVAGTHDVQAMSRAAFTAGEDLLRAGVDARTIDAGYAFDGWWVFETQQPGERLWARPTDGWWVQHLFPTIRTDFVVSLSPTLDYARMAPAITGGDRALFLQPRLDGYRVVRTYRYRTFWPWRERALYVLVDERAALPAAHR